MTQPASRPWLPQSATTREPVRSALEEVVREWSEAWIVKRHLRIRDVVEHLGEIMRTASAQSLGARGLIEIRWGAGRRQLLEAVVDMPALGGGVPADADVLERLEREAICDLAKRLEGLLDDAAGNSEAVVEIEIAAGAGPTILTLRLPVVSLASLYRRSLPPLSAASALPPLQRGLRRCAMQLETELGRARLGIGELRNLAIGDVLVLDTPLDELLDVHVQGGARRVARAHLVEAQGRAALHMRPAA